MTHWTWLNDNGDIYLKSKVATVIIHGYQPHEWDIDSFEQHSDIILHTPFDYDLVLLPFTTSLRKSPLFCKTILLYIQILPTLTINQLAKISPKAKRK